MKKSMEKEISIANASLTMILPLFFLITQFDIIHSKFKFIDKFVFFLLIVLGGLGLFYFRYLMTKTDERIAARSKVSVFIIGYIIVCFLTMNIYYWPTQTLAPTFLSIQIGLMLLALLICSSLYPKDYMHKWVNKNVRIFQNEVFFKTLDTYEKCYPHPQHPVLKFIYVYFLNSLKLAAFSLAILGGASGFVLLEISKKYLNEAIDPYYFGLSSMGVIALPFIIAAILPPINFELWWRKNRKELKKKHGGYKVHVKGLYYEKDEE